MNWKKARAMLLWMLVAFYSIWSAIHHLRAGEDVWAALMIFTAVLAFSNVSEARE